MWTSHSCSVLLGGFGAALACASGATGDRHEPAAPDGPVPVVELAASDAESSEELDDPIEPEPRGSGCTPDTFIEDGEDQNNQHELGGYWFTYADTDGSAIDPQPGALGGIFSMTEGGASGSRYSARVFGVVGNAEVRYAGVGFNFVDPKAPFDASQYDGVVFFAKIGDGVTRTRVHVSFPDRNTDPDGGACNECYNHFGVELELTTRWQPYEVRFSKLEQAPGWGNPRPESIEPTTLYGMQFQLSDGGTFDVWLDELRLMRCRP